MKETKVLVTYAVQGEFVDIKWPNTEFYYLRTGIGKVKSAHYLTEAIADFQPDVVLNIGSAGSVTHCVGDVFYCTQFVDRDMEQIKELGTGYRIDNTIILMENNLAQLWPNEGLCNTGDRFVTDLTNLEGDVIDMEAYAQAFVCEHKNIPFISVKAVSDKIGETSLQIWEERLKEAKTALTTYLNETVKGL